MKSLILLVFLYSCHTLNIEEFTPKASPKLNRSSLKLDLLTKSKKISLKGHYGPEDILISNNNEIYTGVHDGTFKNGKLLKISKSGDIETIFSAQSWISGLEWLPDNNIVALVLDHGIVSVNPKTKESKDLLTAINGKAIKIPNDVAVGPDGTIFFTVTSFVDKFTMGNAMKIALEQRKKGGVFQLNPLTLEVKELYSGGVFLNGIEVSKDGNYILFIETAQYRVHKLWLSGPKKGQKEILIDNLEGIPNGISKSSDGNYWIGFSSKRNEDLDFLHKNSFLKSLVYNLPESFKPQLNPFGMVMKISSDGHILSRHYDKYGTVVKEATSVVEKNGIIYFGGDRSSYIPYLEL